MEDKSPQLSIGVIGSGIAGVSAAYYLGKEHRVTLFESRERLGGHTHTVTVEDPSAGSVPVDTGFIVCNDRTYPHFHSFLEELRVPVRSGDMSFGYYDENSNFGYAPTGVSGLVPQWSHLVNRSYLKLWMTLPRFNKRALRNLHSGSLTGLTLREYVERENVSAEFVQLFLVPMGAAIWSSADEKLLETPAETFFGFFKNHGLLTLFDRPQWQTVVGGSHQYLKAFEREFSGKIRLNSRVSSVKRPMGKVEISTDQGSCEEFDLVVFACHADQVLPILEDATEIERTLFAPWKYHSNRTVLHTDKSYLPPDKKIWASWNYRRERGEEGSEPLSVTYHMNRLQGLNCQKEYCVTLNPRREIAREHVIRGMTYMHPMYTTESVATQPKILEYNGTNSTFFCGSYLGWGFHEDAIRSSMSVVARLTGGAAREYLQSQPHGSRISGVKCQYGATGAI